MMLLLHMFCPAVQASGAHSAAAGGAMSFIVDTNRR